jgi:uncharacterized repeat protein (TIGR03803 family)
MGAVGGTMRQYLMLLTLSFAAAGCSQQSSSSPVSNYNLALPQVRGGSYSVIYSFKGAPDGDAPHGALWHDYGGSFYGTTARGGTGNGTFFNVSDTGAETVFYSFGNKPGAVDPEAGVIVYSEVLDGTSYAGGTNDAGSVYEIQNYGGPMPTVSVLHSFTGPDGAKPNAPLTLFFRTSLVGTTSSGGSAMKGVVFEALSGSTYEYLDHSFTGKPDGDRPEAGLMELDYHLYGTTEAGGANDMGCVFEVLPDGKKTEEHVVHSFNGTDGAAPRAGLTVLNGLLYGTTQSGGAHNDGTVFEVHKDGTERVVYSFAGSDGRDPVAGLTVLNGMLYGTTYRGGSHDAGTIFEVQTNGTFRMLHDFTGAPDGYGPAADLTEYNGTLYGTTDQGGANNKGTVFKVVP